MNDLLIEPLKYYNSVLKDNQNKNAEVFFDELVVKSNIDVEENRQTVKKYKAKQKEVENITKELNKYKTYRVLMIIALICDIGYAVYYIYNQYNYNQSQPNYLVLSSCVLLLILFLVLIFKFLNPKIKNIDEIKRKLESEAQRIKDECYRQMEPLNALYDSDDTRLILLKTFPDISMDKYFNMKRFEYLKNKYGLGDNDDIDSSSLKILTGDILGNPYVIVKELSHVLSDYTYTGSLTIYWETYSYDDKGNRIVEHHSQTLHASVTKPKPYYSENMTLIYGNEAAEHLSFSRKAGHIEKRSDKEIERIVKRGAKAINKKAQAINSNVGFTPLGNDEFDVLFNATDRDNETEFRLLFTPLAQKNMLDLLKNSPYGDDFSFKKRKKINYISSAHSHVWDTDTSNKRFYNFDIDDAKKNFILFQNEYFKHFYFELAPLLSIPLYQQHKPSEYIYKHDYVRNYTSYQTEVMANLIGENKFCHPLTKTRSIIKTTYNNKNGLTDNVSVKAYSYDTKNHTSYISVYGNDGHYHDVPVEWVEYIPLTYDSEMNLKDIKLNDSEFRNASSQNEFYEYLKKYSASHAFDNGLFAMKTNNKDNSNSDEDMDILLKKMFNK